jgi:hypothetical protein
VKSLASGPERAVRLGQAVDRVPRRWPIATTSVLAVTVVVTVLQFPFPAVRLALWRDPDALAAGQWWRLVTALFVQNDLWWQIVIVFALIAGIGAFAERLFGPGRWLLLYFGCGVVGQGFGFRWQPYDAGASVAGAGLLGAVCAWLLSPAGPPLARVRVWGVAWPLAGLALTAAGDIHGPPLLLGFGLGALFLWSDRHATSADNVGQHRTGRPRSRRDLGLTALIEGFFAFVWFGWGQANAGPGLGVGLAVAGVVAALVAVAGGIQAFRGPASTGVLHDRQARRRYGVTVGVEFGLAGVGAAVLAAAGQGDFIPVWVCAVVGVHFFALARLLEDPLLVPLGASVTAVALVALVAGLATGVAPCTVTGVGAGTLLTGFALAALAGTRAEETPQHSSPDRPV